MFCPNCHYEYVPGVTTCPDCGADLVYKLPPESAKPPQEPEGSDELATIFETNNFPDLAIAKSILEEANIEYIVISTGGSYWGHSGRAVQVSTGDAEQARALLADLAKGSILELPSDFEMEGDSEDKEKP